MAEYEPTAHVRALMQEMTALEARIESLRLQAKVGMWASMASPPVALAGLWTDEWWPTIVVVFLAVFSVGAHLLRTAPDVFHDRAREPSGHAAHAGSAAMECARTTSPMASWASQMTVKVRNGGALTGVPDLAPAAGHLRTALATCGHSFWSNADGDPQCIHCGHIGHVCVHGRIQEHCERCEGGGDA